jgi:serine/threonine-protein kinase
MMTAFSSTDELTVFSSALAGQYEVEREIGRGGMGVVYLARDLRLDRMVAIKTLPLHLANDPAIRERFLREARTAARLSHPNIVPVHRADEVGGQVFFVMGFVDGDSLAATLAAAGALSPKRAVPILRDVASALGYAHERGVIHRDVKTENILLDTLSGRAMVSDFGIARVGEAVPLTATGQVLGTVYYLSPEQVSGEGIDARSDVYALGVVGYAMLSGQFPFDGPLASAVLVAHVNKQPVPLAAIAPHVPASLASIIDRCLAKNPAHRYQSCADLDAALALAEPDASRVSTALRPSQSPLISNTEAQAIFGRAAELQDMTRPYSRPADPMERDAERDAARKEGFKTANLREAAHEAGIDEQFMEHALAERGLRVPPPDKKIVIRDFSRPANFWRGEPAKLAYEVVIDGEMPSADFDLMVDIIRRSVGEHGSLEMVGRSMTWTGKDIGAGKPMQVSVFPRNGKTTIRASDSLRGRLAATYLGIMGLFGGGLGAIAFGIAMETTHRFYDGSALSRMIVRDDRPVHIAAGFGLWALAGVMSFVGARFFANSASSDRQEFLKSLLGRLSDQTIESIRFNDK